MTISLFRSDQISSEYLQAGDSRLLIMILSCYFHHVK